jgi:hypothetical protein
MKPQLLVALTVVNFGLLVFSLARPRDVGAQDIAPVLLRNRFIPVVQVGQFR